MSNIDTFTEGSLETELDTPLLDELYPNLWLVGRRSGNHIDPLHVQVMRGRKIVVAEDTDLHLIWTPQEVWIKPIPEALLDTKTWQQFWSRLNANEHKSPWTGRAQHSPSSNNTVDQKCNILSTDLCPKAAGLMRSYTYLIRYPSDLRLAQSHLLLPNDWTWQEWIKFAQPFRNLADTTVAKRYRYGQLRLSRLNWAVRVYGPRSAPSRWFYRLPFWSIGQYLRAIVVPVAFVYTSLSLVLAAMQVMVSGSSSSDTNAGTVNDTVQNVFWIFCIIVLIALGVIWLLFTVLPVIVLVWQLQWGYRKRVKEDDDIV